MILCAVYAQLFKTLCIETLSKQGFEVLKVAKNMINFLPQRIHAYLAAMNLVPEQKRLAA